MTMLPRTIYLTYPLAVTAQWANEQLPNRIHMRGCSYAKATHDKSGRIMSAVLASEYDALRTIELRVDMVGENVGSVAAVEFKETA